MAFGVVGPLTDFTSTSYWKNFQLITYVQEHLVDPEIFWKEVTKVGNINPY